MINFQFSQNFYVDILQFELLAPLFFLTLNLLTTTIVAPPSNASKWQMGFNSAFKGLTYLFIYL